MPKLMEIWNQVKKKPIQTKNEAGNTASLFVYDAIYEDTWFGSGVSAKSVIKELEGINAEHLNVYINSPGGDVFEARAIASNLKRLSQEKGIKTTAIIDGLCASAATYVALACDEVHMNIGCQFMIHQASGCCYGTKGDMRAYADLMEGIEKDIIADYVAKTGKQEDEITEMLEAETWMSSEEALEHGFIDLIVGKKAEEEPEEPKDVKNSVGVLNANRLKLLLAQ